MERLKFEECKTCKEWGGSIADCLRICGKPLDALEEFNRYRELEKQEVLIKLPCKVGDTVYVKMQFGGCEEAEVVDYVYFCTCGFCVAVHADKFGRQNIPFTEFGKSIFITQEEAEAALRPLGEPYKEED